jgi:hypothetical protein
MKTYTLFELQQFEAYPILKNILNDAEIQVFFNTPKAQRGSKIPNKVISKVAPKQPISEPIVKIFTPKDRNTSTLTAVVLSSTQKCTTVSIDSIHAMALDYMGRDFEYNGNVYNLNKLGWKFEFSNKKIALGTCISNRRTKLGTIQLSKWIITNSEESYDKWVNTMLHEIAHAIDVTIRSTSDHSWIWQYIARSIGCDAKRTTNVEYVDLLENPISRYTLVCPNGHTEPSFRKKRPHSRSSCTTCGKESGIKGFNKEFLLTQIENY